MLKSNVFFIITAFSLIFSLELKSQILEKNQNNVDSIQSELLDSLESMRYRIEAINSEIQIREKDIKEKIDNASDIIGYLNSVIGTYGNILSVLGVFIALIAIVIPFASYQYAVKPAKEALSQLENNFDERLSNYLIDIRNNQIKKAFQDIAKGSPQQKNHAASFLSNIQNEGLTDNQLFQIYSLIKKNDSGYNIKSQLAFILSNHKSDYANELFTSKEAIKDPAIRQMALMYYAKTDYKENFSGLKIIFEENPEQQSFNFNVFIQNIILYNPEKLETVINDKVVIDLLKPNELKKISESLTSILNTYNSDVDIKNSLLVKKIQKSSDFSGDIPIIS